MSKKQIPDLEKITPPLNLPPDSPDQQTEAEDKEIERRLTPTEQLSRVHLLHAEEQKSHIDYHRDECDKWKSEVDKLQGLLLEEKDKARATGEKLAGMQANARSVGGMHLISTIFGGLGGLGLGVAGAISGLPEIGRIVLASVGGTFMICAIVLAIWAFLTTQR